MTNLCKPGKALSFIIFKKRNPSIFLCLERKTLFFEVPGLFLLERSLYKHNELVKESLTLGERNRTLMSFL